MATTALVGQPLSVVGTALRSSTKPVVFAYGRAVLASGVASVVTGLTSVDGFWVTESGTVDANDAVIFQVNEDLPSANGTVTVASKLLVDDASVAGNEITANASGAQYFCWLAIGEK